MIEETNNLPSQDAADSERSGDRRLSTCSALGCRVKVSKAARRDFEFFFATELNLIGGTDSDAVLIDQMQSPDGYTAVECWHLSERRHCPSPR